MRFRDRLLRAKIRVLRVGPDDVVVLEATRPATREQCEAVRERWAEQLPDIQVAVLDGLKVGAVLRPDGEGATSA